jgi:DNA-binding transcriptional MocR family regulator
MPTLHNPLGWVLDDVAHEHLVAIGRTHDLLLIEDASYAFLAESAPAPLVSRAPERTYWLSSLSGTRSRRSAVRSMPCRRSARSSG